VLTDEAIKAESGTGRRDDRIAGKPRDQGPWSQAGREFAAKVQSAFQRGSWSEIALALLRMWAQAPTKKSALTTRL